MTDLLSRPTANLNTNLSQILQLGQFWGSDTMIDVYNSLVEPTEDANSGGIIGNRNFYNNDYMVSSTVENESSYSHRVFRFSADKVMSPH